VPTPARARFDFGQPNMAVSRLPGALSDDGEGTGANSALGVRLSMDTSEAWVMDCELEQFADRPVFHIPGMAYGWHMNVGDEHTKSIWVDTVVAADAVALDHDIQADTVVVGSGIAGLSTAYELSEQGHRVVVLDRGAIGTGMTARTTAHLSSISDDGFDTLIEIRGEENARLFYESHSASIDRIEAIQERLGIACDFRRLEGLLFPQVGGQSADLNSQLESARQLGVKVKDDCGLPFKGQENTRYLSYADQAAFHPLKYLRGLAGAIRKNKGQLYSNTSVMSTEETGGGVVVGTESGRRVRAEFAVVATNSPINNIVAIHTKEAPYRTYAMAFQIPRGTLPDLLYWDTADPYHYVRLSPGAATTDYLIVGGADHKTGEADDGNVRFEGLEAWIRSLVPNLGRETHRWSGQVLEPVDHGAFIGRNPGSDKVFIVTGDSGQGITHGVVGSLMISDEIMKRSNPWAALYDPSRIATSAIKTFIAENVTALKNFAEYLAPGELKSFDELKPGHGAVVRDGLQKVAAYRNEKGVLSKCSAKCTHVGCHIHWNSLELCWDCPCHGSQFARTGEVLNAPAVSPLAKIDAHS
jgi:glycine/D-amino acid oxidase-like deaminating enzyme/nitrite reductase/ring-hydroxylating ferredoxin subunit